VPPLADAAGQRKHASQAIAPVGNRRAKWAHPGVLGPGESRRGRIAPAACEALPKLKEVIVSFNDQCKMGEYPAGELNNRRVGAVEEAIRSIEAATTQPELRSIAPEQPKRSSSK